MKKTTLAIAAACVLALAAPAQAQDWPQKTIRIIGSTAANWNQ